MLNEHTTQIRKNALSVVINPGLYEVCITVCRHSSGLQAPLTVFILARVITWCTVNCLVCLFLLQMYTGGRLLFADHIFNGYGNAKKDFLKQV